MDIGATLRDARERHGLSLESVSVKTKIRVDQLRALEDNAFERLPSGIFARGFIRAYAREVGLDSEQIVSSYRAEFGENRHVAETVPAGASAAAAETASPSVDVRAEADPFLPISLRSGVIAAALLVPLALWLMALPLLRRPPNPAPTPAPAGAPEVSTPAPAPPPPTPVATSGQPLQVVIKVQRPCWIAATADGQR